MGKDHRKIGFALPFKNFDDYAYMYIYMYGHSAANQISICNMFSFVTY